MNCDFNTHDDPRWCDTHEAPWPDPTKPCTKAPPRPVTNPYVRFATGGNPPMPPDAEEGLRDVNASEVVRLITALLYRGEDVPRPQNEAEAREWLLAAGLRLRGSPVALAVKPEEPAR